MSQLIENKQNDPILIANFEPNEIAKKSACPPRREEKTKIQTRKHCAGEPAQKVEIQTQVHCAGEAVQKEAKLSRANKSSWTVLQARLLDLPGSTSRRPGSPKCDLGGPRFFLQKGKTQRVRHSQGRSVA
jgi:hypothetical protein